MGGGEWERGGMGGSGEGVVWGEWGRGGGPQESQGG